MDFYTRYEALCKERGFNAQSKEMFEVTGVTTGTISGWKKGVEPKASVVIKIAKYFGVSTDYLLCIDELRNLKLSKHEQLIVDAFRLADEVGQQEIIYVCRTEMHRAEERIRKKEKTV